MLKYTSSIIKYHVSYIMKLGQVVKKFDTFLKIYHVGFGYKTVRNFQQSNIS